MTDEGQGLAGKHLQHHVRTQGCCVVIHKYGFVKSEP